MPGSQDGLSTNSSAVHKTLFGLMKAITSPRSSLAWVLRGHLVKDPVFARQMYWYTGTLPRVPLTQLLPSARDVDVVLPRAFDRTGGTSITVEEACHLAAIAKATGARKALEIGTFDGNTTLVLATNLGDAGQVVTVDLPPDFQAEQQDGLALPGAELNLTPRGELGRQYRGHPYASRIRQVYGDSAKLDWGALGGPFDLIFIDGCHSESYVRSDSLNALGQLAPAGVIVWHDYGMIADVSRAVDRLAQEATGLRISAIEGTRLAVGLR
jgi:predicted O-methyltransferase YrrM